MSKVAILVTAFLRDKLMYDTVQSIIDNYSDNFVVLIADQGYRDEEKSTTYDYFVSQINCEVHYLPFDCGISVARNFLISRAKELDIPYCLMLADSLQFTSVYNFDSIVEFLNSDEKFALVGFTDIGRKAPWEFNLYIDKKGIHFVESLEKVQVNNELVLKKIDICNNVFLAKTDAILNIYDNEMKLCEHELMFIELKKRCYQCFYTDSIKFKHASRTNDEYDEYRKRFGDYQKLLRQKLNIESWIIYDKPRSKNIS
jgi:hypothetical protein